MKKRNVSTPPPRAGAVDWTAIHQRVEAARAAIERGRSPDPADARAILAERARKLAHEAAPVEEAGDAVEVIEFVLAHETYGLEARYVREIYPLKDLTPMPGTPAFVLGIINLRGQILSIIDLRQFFDLPRRGLTDLNKVIVLRSGAMEFGVLADAIVGTRTIALRSLQPSLPTLTGIREQYLKGIDSGRAVILDAAKLLESPAVIVNEYVNTST